MARSSGTEADSLRQALRVADGPVTLLGYDPGARPLAPGKSRASAEVAAAQTELQTQQDMLYAAGTRGDQRRILLVLQGMDCSGKDGVVRHVVGLFGPTGVTVHPFKRPTPAEAAHHFLWRIRRALPAAGMIGVFNRSHYEDVLAPKVHGELSDTHWQQRVEQILAFEHELTEAGTTIIKCMLHISFAEQRQRLLQRLEDESKYWKFNPRDLDERARWTEYQAAYAAVLSASSTDESPWYIVPADRKWYRDWAIGRILAEALTDLRLSYPPADFDVEECRRRLRPPF